HSTLVTIESENAADFTFTLTVNSSPVISIVGGNPLADIVSGSTTTTSTNGTFFGTHEPTDTEDRRYYIVNTGNCPMDITSITSSNGDFTIDTPVGAIPPASYTLAAGGTFQFDVDLLVPNTSGEITSTITVVSNSSNAASYTFTVSAEIFDYNIPGPGGVTADFRLWLKSTRGITETASKVSLWEDLGTNSKDAEQPVGAKQPTYLDDVASNINFNPVIKFENDGAGTEQFMFNDSNGFYSQEIFIVMVPDATMSNASSQNAIFSGVSSGNAGDITGVAFGDSSSEFTNETIAYNQDVDGGGSFNGYAELSSTYADPGIINISNESGTPTFQDIIYNSEELTISSVDDIAYANVGGAGLGTEYWIGKTFDTQGSLNGRVAEILTFAQRLSDGERTKVESYLAIKYGITLGAGDQADKDYKNSWDTKIWDISQSGSAYNYHVAGIGRDSLSDLNQKQSKTINTTNEVTIGLGGIYDKNSDNTNEFENDGDFLVWGSNNAVYTGTSTNTVTIATGITTTLTRVDRKWRIEEKTEVGSSDVRDVYVSIPEAAFSGFTKTADEEYVLIVADAETFLDADIIDVLPLKSDGAGNLKTWYDFDGLKFFTFGKAPKLTGDRAIDITNGDYLVGESALNLNINEFTISAWVKIAPGSTTRTVMSKGDKLQIRINAQEEVEVMIDDTVTPRFTSDMQLSDSKWHHIAFVYSSGTVYLYIDGILDKSEQDVLPPTPNFNKYAVGSLYIDKDNISNPLLGEVDEIYVWDQELSAEQVRFLMNQEIERLDVSGTDYVQGKVIPGNSIANVAGTIPWSNLKAYYDFNSFYGSTVEGLTDDRNFLRLRYLDKDKTLISTQTAPLPYVTTANGVWNTAGIWANNTVQLLPNSVGLDGTTVIGWNIVEIDHEISSGDNDISLNGLISNNAKLIIADPNETLDEDNSGQSLTIRNYIELDGVIDLVGESQLIQTEDSIIDADSGGYIERDQQGTASSYHYNYWSSSVGPISGNSATRGTGVAHANGTQNVNDLMHDGTDTDAYQNIAFSTSAYAADNGPNTPAVVSRYWMYKFYGPANDASSWTPINEFSNLLPGEGFTMKGTEGAADINTTFQNYVFKGIPNNGDILLPLDINVTGGNPSGNVDRLVGNPYPSAIDATEFILDNLSIADGGRNTNGTIFN
ncbi:MAG: LamG domain-containing protein, partial [Bacteroidia bacterium]|nr:LamG domain-containing protein [Bacteroidia bacterium]